MILGELLRRLLYSSTASSKSMLSMTCGSTPARPPTSWNRRSMPAEAVAFWAWASIETNSMFIIWPWTSGGAGGRIPAREAIANTVSTMGLRTSLSIRSSTGPSITRDSDLRRSHSIAVTFERVSYWEATLRMSLKKVALSRCLASLRSSVISCTGNFVSYTLAKPGLPAEAKPWT